MSLWASLCRLGMGADETRNGTRSSTFVKKLTTTRPWPGVLFPSRDRHGQILGRAAGSGGSAPQSGVVSGFGAAPMGPVSGRHTVFTSVGDRGKCHVGASAWPIAERGDV